MAGQIVGPYLDHPERTQRRCNIRSDSTGLVHNNNVVSKDCPDFMKSPLESCGSHFDRRGVSEVTRAAGKLRLDPDNHPGGFVEAGQPSAAKVPKMASVRSQIVHEETGKLFNQTVLSNNCPDWMNSPFESNRDHFDRIPHLRQWSRHRGLDRGTRIDPFELIGNNSHLPTFAQKGAAREPRPGDWSCKRTQIANVETGQLHNQHSVSLSAPDFMRQTLPQHAQSDQGTPRPREYRGLPAPDADVHCAGLGRMERPDHVWGHGGLHGKDRTKRMNIKCESGAVRGATALSAKAPDFMCEPFHSNRDHLESRDLRQSVHTHKAADKETAGKRIFPQEQTFGVPDWMVQDGEAHQQVQDAAFSARLDVNRQRRAGNLRCGPEPFDSTRSFGSRSTASGLSMGSQSARGLARSSSASQAWSRSCRGRQGRLGGRSEASGACSVSRSGCSSDFYGTGYGPGSFATSYMYGSSMCSGSGAAPGTRVRPGTACPAPRRSSRCSSRGGSRSSSACRSICSSRASSRCCSRQSSRCHSRPRVPRHWRNHRSESQRRPGSPRR